MTEGWTPEALQQFEAQVADEFNSGRIRAPVHLAGGNEWQLISIFQSIRPQDWVFCQWRSHYHCLLKGVPPSELRDEITSGRSISLCFPRHKVMSSAIVGGHLPAAVGVALAAKRSGADDKVFAFMGDMTARSGIAHECIQYADGHDLPILFVIEDNGKSVCTNTRDAWGQYCEHGWRRSSRVLSYSYELPWPHAGAGKRVQF